jgi:hypothetical protein
LEVAFTITLFAEGHKYWGIIQIFIAFIIPYIIGLVTGCFYIKELNKAIQKDFEEKRNAEIGENNIQNYDNDESQEMDSSYDSIAWMMILAIPMMNFFGLHYFIMFLAKRIKDNEKMTHQFQVWIKISAISVKTSNTVDQDLGYLFKSYLLAKGANPGTSVLILILEFGYIIWERINNFCKGIKYNENIFHSIEVITLFFAML